MSGHNKWSSIKHRKAAQDAKRGNAFNKVIRELVVAAKEGGADPATNFSLASAMEKAKSANMPKDTMEKAIKRGAGDSGADNYERITYEGRGPGNTQFMIFTLTDNRNRAVAEIRHAFSKNGGEMTDNGSVSWNFERKGLLTIEAAGQDEDALLEACAEAGADDFKQDGEAVEIYCGVEDLEAVKRWFMDNDNFRVKDSDLAMVPKDSSDITDPATAKKLLRLLDALDENDDVQRVYSNWSMSDELLEQVAGE